MSYNNLLIMGDSYSTFEGYIPEGFKPYYTIAPREETDVNRVEQTWWHQLVAETGTNLVLNNSWSGSTICYTGYNGNDCSQTSSFIYRFRQLVKEGFFEKNKIDTFFIFGGTNDSWCGSPLGEPKYADWQEQDLYCALPAISCLLKTARDQLPDTKIYCLLNTDMKPEFYEVFGRSCELYGVTPVPLENIRKSHGHPTIEGMKDIKNQVLAKAK